MASTDRNAHRRGQVMVGDLPGDFLTVGGNVDPQVEADHQAAAMLQAQQQGYSFVSPNMAKISITVSQAKLNKNYGIVKMDPYCRVRIGHSVFETPTAHSGGKNPRWNKVVHCYLPAGVDHIYLELFDERAFTMDDRFAWAHIPITERVLAGETVEDWYPLNGKLGENKEGLINLVLSYNKSAPAAPVVYQQPYAPAMVIQGGLSYPTYSTPGVTVIGAGQQPVMLPQQPCIPQQQQQQQPQEQHLPAQPQQPMFTDEDVNQIKEMFPNMDGEVIKSVLEVNRGNKDATINSLLTMEL